MLALLLRLELLQLPVLLLDLSLLCRQLLLHRLFLLLSRLHLVADQGAADQTDCSADAGSGSGVSCSAANDGAQARSGQSSDAGALLPRRQRLEQPRKNAAKEMTKTVVRALCISCSLRAACVRSLFCRIFCGVALEVSTLIRFACNS